MWAGAGESNGTFGMSAVATSGYPDGPFRLRRTLYPDGNETHDQTVFEGEAVFLFTNGNYNNKELFSLAALDPKIPPSSLEHARQSGLIRPFAGGSPVQGGGSVRLPFVFMRSSHGAVWFPRTTLLELCTGRE